MIVKHWHSRVFKYWQNRILITSIVGYAGFYLVRNNMAIAIPKLQADLAISNVQIGLILSTFHILYAFGKGFGGIAGDRNNARYFMTIGLLLSALMNICVGFSNSFHMLLACWACNAVFQSMGWPACARLLTHWFSKEQLASKWSIWNTSQQFGMLGMYTLSAYALYLRQWRYIFLMPATAAVIIAAFLLVRLRDTPASMGLKVPNEKKDESTQLSIKEILFDKILHNKAIWFVCIANFFVYFVRLSVMNWGPKFLIEFKGNRSGACITHTMGLELAGMMGGLLAGHICDKVFENDRNLVSILFMLGVTFFVVLLWRSPMGASLLHFLIMLGIGFFITGPQILIGVSAASYASKKAAGAATGLSGLFGSAGGVLEGVGMGIILDYCGWNTFFIAIILAGLIGCSFLVLARNCDLVAQLELENQVH